MAAGTPAIQELVPDNIKAGSSGFTLTVNGSHFANGAVVYWNGSARTTMFALPGQITAAISDGRHCEPGHGFGDGEKSGRHRNLYEPAGPTIEYPDVHRRTVSYARTALARLPE